MVKRLRLVSHAVDAVPESRAQNVSATLESGAIGVNGWSPLGPQLPSGGMKASGLGRELGYDGILANTETQTVTMVL